MAPFCQFEAVSSWKTLGQHLIVLVVSLRLLVHVSDSGLRISNGSEHQLDLLFHLSY